MHPGQKLINLLEHMEGFIQLKEFGRVFSWSETDDVELQTLKRKKDKLKNGILGRMCLLERRQYTFVLNEVTPETLDVYDACLGEKMFLFDYIKSRYPEIAVEYLRKTGQL